MSQTDRYFKLKPPEGTPADEVCHCLDAPPIKLMCAITYNPVYCMNCNSEVPPEELAMSEQLAQSIAQWRQVYDALDMLWLDSGDYEDWAKSQLLDVTGQVNILGRQCQTELNKIRRCYYTLFKDTGDSESETAPNCPVCQQQLLEYDHGKFPGEWLTCEDCLLVIQAKSA
jgi:predicted  nucleic acid-binding Zn ribbon protein